MGSLISRNSNLLDELFRDITSGFYVKPLHGDPLPVQIKVDVKESDAGYTIHAELPGVGKDDINVSVEGRVVTLRAEVRQHDSESKDGQVLRSERYYGTVARSLQLPAEVDSEQARAKYENGVLTLTLPKKTSNSGKRLTVE